MNERMSKIIYDPKTLPIAVGVVSLSVGGVVGYILGRRKPFRYDLSVHRIPDSVFDPDKVEI